MSAQENSGSKNLSKPHPDSGDLVQTLLVVAIFMVISIAGMGAMGGIMQDKSQRAADMITSSQTCLVDVAKATEDMKDPHIGMLFDETSDDNTHHLLFSINRSFNTDLDTKYLKCETDSTGKVTDLSSVTPDEADVLMKDFETAALDKEVNGGSLTDEDASTEENLDE